MLSARTAFPACGTIFKTCCRSAKTQNQMNTTPRVSYSWLKAQSDDEVTGTIMDIVTAMTDNSFFPTPAPPLVDVQSLLVGFQTAQAVAANGGKVETAAKSTARDILVESTHSLGDYIDRAAGGNLEKLLSSSYPLQKDRAPVDIQPAPANLRLKHGKVSGSIAAYCDPNTHRVLYEWQTAAGASPTEWQIEPSTNSARSVFSGHAPGSWLYVRVRARVPAGAGDWSSVIQIMVI